MPGDEPQSYQSRSGNCKRAVGAYVLLLTVNVLTHFVTGSLFTYLIPFLLIGLPLILKGSVKLRLAPGDLILGCLVSLALLLPLFVAAISSGRVFVAPSLAILAFQLLAISFPEEVFFRGFLQESLGNDKRALVVASVLFAFAHFPRALLDGEWVALLTFFPSLVMGWLYYRTGNILPGIIFHFLANVLFIGFAGHLP